MVLGLSLYAFTLLHTGISLIGIAAGVLFFVTLARGRWHGGANTIFLVFTILTSVTGFLFPWKGVTPAVIFGVISLAAFAVALFALYARGGAGWWRIGYLAPALFAQWLNMVVLVVQSYQKIPALNALAPTGGEPAVLATQTVLLCAVAYVGWLVLRPSRIAPTLAA